MLLLSDIQFFNYGFCVTKITKASDDKLGKIEEELTEKIGWVDWANIDDMGYLSVNFGRKMLTTDDERQIILKTLNKLFKNL